MTAKKLRDIDLQTLHLLGAPAKIMLALLTIISIIVVAYFALFRSQLDILGTAQEKETELKSTYTKKSIEAASLDNLKAELAALRQSFNVLLKQLPTDAEIPNLIQELHQAGATNGLRMDSVTPKAPVNDGPIQVLPYDIAITGQYRQINQFTRDVGALSRIITLDSLNVSKSKDEKSNQLTLSATANTYKVRPAEEVAKEMAAAASAASEVKQ